MAEEEMNYATVVFKTENRPTPKAKEEEETVYNEVKVKRQTPEQTAHTEDFLLEEKPNSCSYYQLVWCLGILCVILLSVIIAVCVYFATSSDDSELADKHNLTNLIDRLRAEKENLTMEHTNLTNQFVSLTQAHAVLKNKSEHLTAQNQNLTAQNQELQTEKKNLTEQTEKRRNELNVTRAQWSIDAYCSKVNGGTQCKPCQGGWETFQSSCYAVNDVPEAEQRTWREARKNCKEKISDLPVIGSREEKCVESTSL
uniref:C-type lectin domain family 10 member A-like n=1 Tax=Semicossyphus pulcher TaxID=241346 RepID=UPI0037E7C841